MILQLKKGYLESSYFQEKFDVDILKHWEPQWQAYEEEGFLAISENRVDLNRDGLLQVDRLLPNFFEAEHRGVRYT